MPPITEEADNTAPGRQRSASRRAPGRSDSVPGARGLKRGFVREMMPSRRNLPRLLLMAIVTTVVLNTARAGDIVINSADTSVVNDMFMVSADMDFQFSDDALEALQSGVALYIEFDVRVERHRAYLWDKKMLALTKRLKIERHALSERYVISDLVTEERRIFDSIDAALAGLSEVANFPVAPQDEFAEGEFDIALRARLDIEALPAPMRPIAYISPAWRMSSGWYQWNLAR